jgi:hypothetical protein
VNINADYVARLEREIARQPIFDRYPPVLDIDSAVTITLERLEEWDYPEDAFGWCHERPVLLTLLRAALHIDSSEA